MKALRLAKMVERISERLNDAHYFLSPGATYYTGGSEHNCDCLTAVVDDDGTVNVSDHQGSSEDWDSAEYATSKDVKRAVQEWLGNLWDQP